MRRQAELEDEFVERLRARLDAGRREYGAVSFERPPDELRGEIEEELLDVAGWAFVLWVRVRSLLGDDGTG